MLSKNDDSKRKNVNIFCVDDLVPKDHILRKIDKAIDFNFIYDLVKDKYCEDNGRPSVDPVVLFKIIFIQILFGIRSMRQTVEEINVNLAYRWFIDYDLYTPIPHFSTFGKNYIRRFKDTDVFEKIFERILTEAVKCDFVDASAVFIDATHIKANANKNKSVSAVVKVKAKHYQHELEEEINKDRTEHGKKTLKSKEDHDDDSMGGGSSEETKEVKISTTDPESGLFHKGEHEKCFAYTSHMACDKNNFILAADVSPGNVHDSVMFDDLYKKAITAFPEIETVAIDAGYKTPWIMKQIIDSKRIPATAYKRPMTKKGFFKKYEYVYDEYYDCMICPQNQILEYATTNRDGYREYKSNPKICKHCPDQTKCTQSRGCMKVVTRHVWEDYMEMAEDYRHTPEIKAIYDKRSQTIERIFADAKEKHQMRYTKMRGLSKVKMMILLTAACMNMKKLAKWKANGSDNASFFKNLLSFLCFFTSKHQNILA